MSARNDLFRHLIAAGVIVASFASAISVAVAGSAQMHMNEARANQILGQHGETLTSRGKSQIVCDEDLNPERKRGGRLSLVPEGNILEQDFRQPQRGRDVIIGGSVLHRGDCQ